MHNRNDISGVKGYKEHYAEGMSRLAYINGTAYRAYNLDPNGNVKKDFAREIDAISYNSLNLPIGMDAVKMVYDPGDHRLMKSEEKVDLIFPAGGRVNRGVAGCLAKQC